MATRVITNVFDDLDGTAGATTVYFALEGTDYAIDLTEANHVALREALTPYVEAGRRQASGHARRTPARRPVTSTPRTSAPQPRFSSAPEPRRPISSPPTPPRPTPTPVVLPASAPAGTVRAWWKSNDKGLPEWKAKGVIPRSVVAAWRASLHGVRAGAR